MIDGIRLKVCGLTTLVDAEFADRVGADCLGFILFSRSPRYLPLRQYRDMAAKLPTGRKRVAVMVEPTREELEEVAATGFDRFQIHFHHDVPPDRFAAWAGVVGRERLWLAPKLPPGAEVTSAMLGATNTLLWDTFHAAGFGGSGQTGDWDKFRAMRAAHPQHTFILAGGLTPENVGAALRASGTNFVDVASGVEVAPGLKDHSKMKAFVLAIHRARSEPFAPPNAG